MEIRTEQLNILMNSIRDIVKNKNCPDWVFKKLSNAVKMAKEYKSTETLSDNNYEVDNIYKPFEINEEVISNVANDTCLYQITALQDPINNINLYTLRIIKGDKKSPAGYIIYNVPETMLQHIKKR